jgi:exonuclease VII large subunit
LQRSQTALAGLDHGAVLARGYSLTVDARGEILRDAAVLARGERIFTSLAQGEVESEVLRRVR